MSADKLSESITSNPLFKKLLADMDNIERDCTDFNARYGEIVRADTSAMSVILRAHLIVEHFIDEYLSKAHPGIQDWEGARLTFAQKQAVIDHPQSAIAYGANTRPNCKSLTDNKQRAVDSVLNQPVSRGMCGAAVGFGEGRMSEVGRISAPYGVGTSGPRVGGIARR